MVGKEDVAALERILHWAHEQAIGPMSRGEHESSMDRQAHGTSPDENETPDHGVMDRDDAGGEEPASVDHPHDETRSDGYPDDDEEPIHGVDEMPRASHFGHVRFGGAPAAKKFPGKRK